MREHPIGFEKDRRNIFDPEDDPPSSDDAVDQGEKVQDAANQNDTKEQAHSLPELIAASPEVPIEDETTSKEKAPPACARKDCTHKPRFDSLFCSDSCGVSSLELDLLYSFQESSDIHPAILRN